MKQLIQYGDGLTVVEELPAPQAQPGHVLVSTSASMISVGTERTAIQFSKKSLLEKAKARPEAAKRIIQRALKDGVSDAWTATKAGLGRPLALGYSAAGTIVDVGEGVTDLAVGRPVACAGAGYATHSEFVSVPRNLVAPMPDELPMEEAAGATIATIALHGFRLTESTLGDTVCVIGLGLVGLCCAQIARAAGCRVIGVDPKQSRRALATALGIPLVLDGDSDTAALESAVTAATHGRGADSVLVAAATPSSAPMEAASAVARDRARVIMVGAAGMELSRDSFFKKELTFGVSRSYGPGRYDPRYEEKGVAYPVGYVPWTENRNLEAVLELMAGGGLRMEPLVSHRFPIAEAAAAYDLITDGSADPLGILLTYPDAVEEPARRVDLGEAEAHVAQEPGVAFIGAGSFATATLLPALKATTGVHLTGVVTASGLSAKQAASRFGFAFAATDPQEIWSHEGTDAVAIVTRHDHHAVEVLAALGSGRHVFCEKPLCLNVEELKSIVAAWQTARDLTVTVGFNRRFAPLASDLKAFLGQGVGPQSIQYRVNAGALPADHWARDPGSGGGRLIGEVCHFIDFSAFLTDAEPTRVRALRIPTSDEELSLAVEFSDGSVSSISYVTQGGPSLKKERIEAHRSGYSGVLDDFEELELHAPSGRPKNKRGRQDKGHGALMHAWVRSLQSGEAAMSFRSIVATTLTTFAAVESCASGMPVEVDPDNILQSEPPDPSDALP